MVFSSLLFLFYFLPVVLLIYFASPRKWRNLVLFISSLVFYAWGEPIYVVLMLFSTVVDFTCGHFVDKYKKKEEMKKARVFVVISMIINLSLLGFFKYTDLIIGTANSLLKAEIPLLKVALPIGISFYTFQTMSYTIDVYRGDARCQTNIISFGAYVAMFPQLIAGPIVRYQTIAEQLYERKETIDGFSNGMKRFVVGIGKKVLLANSIGIIWTEISGMDISTLPVLTAWIGIIAFGFQIFFDFSAYSDMAIGLGEVFGFKFLENFNYPYLSKSITEFWRRWHISLGTWFKEYVYIPLGGNRCSKLRNIFNISVVWLLTGIWHGASWNFLLWGVYFGVILIMEKLFLLKLLKKLPSFIQRFYTLFLVIIGWTIFASTGTNGDPTIIEYLKAMFGFNKVGFIDNQSIYYLISNVVLFVVVILASTELPKKVIGWIKLKLETKPVIKTIVEALAMIIVFVLSVAYLVDSSYNPFLYFRF